MQQKRGKKIEKICAQKEELVKWRSLFERKKATRKMQNKIKQNERSGWQTETAIDDGLWRSIFHFHIVRFGGAATF